MIKQMSGLALALSLMACASPPAAETVVAAAPPAPPAQQFVQSPSPVDPEVGKNLLASLTLPLAGAPKLNVTSGGWANGADIAFKYTQYETNTFPGLTWSAGPAGTKSYAIIMQDTDLVMRGSPILHWSVVNIPASVTSLPPGMAPEQIPAGSIYGPNYKGATQPYLGPRTPPGPKHRYHIQVLAVDTVLPADFTPKSYAELIEPLKGHVIAWGDVVGLGQEKKAS
jgi:Raf kinase inhibitor-like YbhB/YbcL family protein